MEPNQIVVARIITCLCWIYFFLTSYKEIKQFIKGRGDFWDDVIAAGFFSGIFFCIGFIGFNIVLIDYIYCLIK